MMSYVYSEARWVSCLVMLQFWPIHLVSSSMTGNPSGVQIANIDFDNLDDWSEPKSSFVPL